jgi:sialate O-acetylesterase
MKYILFPTIILFHALLAGMQLKPVIELEGKWQFEIGDDLNYASPNYNSSHWEIIQVPSRWENEGFPGYDGLAWYRKTFQISDDVDRDNLYLKLGRIDDVDMVYLNGVLIGQQGQFPPNYRTAWNVKRAYKIPPKLLRFRQENIIAIRVYDGGESGGIVHGDVGVYLRTDIIDLAIDLSGPWKFKPADNIKWANPDYNDSEWPVIQVPAQWEEEGYRDLDGYAWYRKTVRINRRLAEDKLILLLGKINDIDQVFFNGELIGETGEMPEWDADDNEYDWDKDNYGLHKKHRAYFIPPDLIKTRTDNIIAVRVFDIARHGGIYKEYVGIATRQEYLKYDRKLK